MPNGIAVNWRTQFLCILRRAGVQPWPRLFHALRASCQTDLANRFPAPVVCEWLGNSWAVARQHYLQVTEEHFEQAIRGAESGAAWACLGMHSDEDSGANYCQRRRYALPCIPGHYLS